MKPDFERMAQNTLDELEVNGIIEVYLGGIASETLSLDLRAAYAAGLERAAEICQARYMGDNTRVDMEARRCAEAIRAEREKTDG